MVRGFLTFGSLILGATLALGQSDPLPQAIRSASQAQAQTQTELYSNPTSYTLEPSSRAPATPPSGNYWFSVDYLFSRFTPTTLPPLVTTSPVGTNRALAGIVGTPGTQVLFGGTSQENTRGGMQLRAGALLNTSRSLGIEADVTVLFERSPTGFAASTENYPILGRPYFSQTLQANQAVLISFPDLSSGRIEIRQTNEAFVTGGAYFTLRAVDNGYLRINSLLGYRAYNYQEDLQINQSVAPIGVAIAAGTNIRTNDHFYAGNQFNGVDVGLRTELLGDWFSLEILTKIAFGQLRRQVDIQGQQTVNVPGLPPQIDNAGFLALISNSGSRTSYKAEFMPELGATLKWHITPNVSFRVGYSALYLHGVVRVADQIDPTININNFPTPQPPLGDRPAFSFRSSDIWVQNLTLGLGIDF